MPPGSIRSRTVSRLWGGGRVQISDLADKYPQPQKPQLPGFQFQTGIRQVWYLSSSVGYQVEKIHFSTAFLNPPIKCFFDGSRLLPVVMPAIIQDGRCCFLIYAQYTLSILIEVHILKRFQCLFRGSLKLRKKRWFITVYTMIASESFQTFQILFFRLRITSLSFSMHIGFLVMDVSPHIPIVDSRLTQKLTSS